MQLRLPLSIYIRTLKERNELDALMPDLLNAMGIVPQSRPQTGTRQYGVDLAAVGPDGDNGDTRTLFLFVIKQGDLGRADWLSTSPQAVHPSLEEILDVYLRSHVAPSAQGLPVKIVLCTSGDMKEEIQPNWAGFAERNRDVAAFEFWGADDLAGLVEQHLLNEHLFPEDDRQDFRRALSLISDPDYTQTHFHAVLHRPLKKATTAPELRRALVRINLATRVVVRWSQEEGNVWQALMAAERSLLWSWHAIASHDKRHRRHLLPVFRPIWATYSEAATTLLDKVQPRASVLYGLSGHCRDSTIGSVQQFELIGLVSAIGLAHFYYNGPDGDFPGFDLAQRAADVLVDILDNNPACGSPPFDRNVVEISLALSLLLLMGRDDSARQWLWSLLVRFQYTMATRRRFPVGTDAEDDLVRVLADRLDDEAFVEMTETSWLIATLAGWCLILDDMDGYGVLAKGLQGSWHHVAAQHWHRTPEDSPRFYLESVLDSGTTDAPVKLPGNPTEFRQLMADTMNLKMLDIISSSQAHECGYFGLDLIAARHFKNPVPAYYWFQFLNRNAVTYLPE